MTLETFLSFVISMYKMYRSHSYWSTLCGIVCMCRYNNVKRHLSLYLISVPMSTIKSIKRENGDFHEMTHIAFKSKVISQFVFNDCECERIHTCTTLTFLWTWHFLCKSEIRSNRIQFVESVPSIASHQMDGRRLHTWIPKTDRGAMHDFQCKQYNFNIGIDQFDWAFLLKLNAVFYEVVSNPSILSKLFVLIIRLFLSFSYAQNAVCIRHLIQSVQHRVYSK